MLKKTSCLAPAFGVTPFKDIMGMILVTLLLLFKSNLDIRQNHLSFSRSSLNKCSHLAPTLGVIKFIIVRNLICAT